MLQFYGNYLNLMILLQLRQLRFIWFLPCYKLRNMIIHLHLIMGGFQRCFLGGDIRKQLFKLHRLLSGLVNRGL
ncbi:hypothetical protein ES319_A07G200400v1 [Gossypium barbadense]|uniref:Uncharacterized protein n=3 Tax=Gossypium TaxID=3633 RepID=A0A5J5V608_GOSBA|nr:hypothetical protein ES319_A07G200400v1 [Gossypium barbadense]TYH10930.1 hypothetical protein ES288_A07G217400v1 [Gossypium darwinii]TYI20137.1 hypothetical protein ES332_A07G215100v1 [Gossypium tomentosum]